MKRSGEIIYRSKQIPACRGDMPDGHVDGKPLRML